MKRIFVTTFLLLCLIGQAQTEQNKHLSNVMPTSPSAFQLLKYGEVPISKYTGVPNISIPLYTIKARGLDIPLSLTYHSNRFKVSEEASWTGLGWSLTSGGSIVQIVNGADDFGDYKNREFPDIDAIVSAASQGRAPSGVLSNCTGTNVNLSTDQVHIEIGNPPNGGGGANVLPINLQKGYLDYEPDVFKFNVLGYSGTFVLDWETETFKCLTDSRIKVIKTNSDHSKITIVLPNGHYCLFSIKEESVALKSGTGIGFNYTVGQKTSRVYKIDEIYTNYNDRIQFKYFITSPIKGYENYSILKQTVEDRGNHSMVDGQKGLNLNSTSSVFQTEEPISYINKIIYNKGVVLFNMSNRTDLVGAKKLDNIIVKTSEFSSGQVIKKYNFNYGYFVGHNNGTANSSNNKTVNENTHRLKLLSITESGKNPYIFTYNSTQLPKKTSLATDYWGYYNGVLNNNGMFPDIFRFNYEIEPKPIYDEYVGNNKSARQSFLKAAVLKKIVYPTKGYTEFNYEINSFTNFKIPNFNNTSTSIYGENHISYGGGLRITMLKNFDSNAQLISKKTYTYQGGKLMTPLHYLNKTYLQNYDYLQYVSGNIGEIWAYGSGYRVNFGTSSFITPSLNASGNFVGYNKVTEKTVSNKNSANSIGSIVSIYENHIDEGVYEVNTNNTWRTHGVLLELGVPTRERAAVRNGSLLKEFVFNKNNDTIKKTINTYNYGIRYNCSNGVKFGPINYRQRGGAENYMLMVYPIRGLDSYLTKTETTDFFGDKKIIHNNTYQYNKYLQLKQITKLNSFGKLETTQNKYSIDDLYEPSLGKISNLREVIKRTDGKIIEHKQFSYINQFSSNKYPINALSSENDVLFDDFNEYKYSDKGSIVKISTKQSNMVTHLIWDYYEKYIRVIIRVEKGTSLPNDIVDRIKGNVYIKDAYKKLRQALPTAMITTYLYDSKHLLINKVNDYGVETTYEYDPFNKLKYVKDYNGNIISRHGYNYKN